METIYFDNLKELKKNKQEIEKKLDIVIKIEGKKVTLEGEPVKEYEALQVLEAINFGFSAKIALSLLEEDIVFRKINIKDHTRRKDLEEVRGRIIGSEGKTKRTIEEISGCRIILNDNSLGLIGSAESIEEATTALTNLIRGTKQGNVYSFLERMNREKKRLSDDLGIKNSKNKPQPEDAEDEESND